MAKIYLFILLSFTVTACSKDFLERYENRIEGAWRLTDVDRRGLGGDLDHLPFRDGEFTFTEGGRLEYRTGSGVVYQGSWDIRKEWRPGNCNTDSDGNRDCDNNQVRTLHINAIDFISQDVKSEYFDEMLFTGTNRFKAFVHSGLHTYVFHFRR
jgi:hypothetical protein